MEKKMKVLFLSTGNSTRGQMAEGFARQLAGDRLVAVNAGIESSDSNPLVTEVMEEVGVDISGQRPKNVAQSLKEHFGYVVTLYDAARERSPVFPFTTNLIQWSVKDPAPTDAPAEEKKEQLRRVRDDIRGKVEGLVHKIAQRDRTAA
ncbi:MAG TPA: arsenate reductase ArsC [Candidatus Acidoferrales bacterium]